MRPPSGLGHASRSSSISQRHLPLCALRSPCCVCLREQYAPGMFTGRRLLAVVALFTAACIGTVPPPEGENLQETDAGTHDAGTSALVEDAGQPPDAGTPPQPSDGGCNATLYCDDFESYAVGTVPNGRWKRAPSNAS